MKKVTGKMRGKDYLLSYDSQTGIFSTSPAPFGWLLSNWGGGGLDLLNANAESLWKSQSSKSSPTERVGHNDDLIRCEVSGEAPLFQTATSSNVMIVVGRRKAQNKKNMFFFFKRSKGQLRVACFCQFRKKPNKPAQNYGEVKLSSENIYSIAHNWETAIQRHFGHSE